MTTAGPTTSPWLHSGLQNIQHTLLIQLSHSLLGGCETFQKKSHISALIGIDKICLLPLTLSAIVTHFSHKNSDIQNMNTHNPHILCSPCTKSKRRRGRIQYHKLFGSQKSLKSNETTLHAEVQRYQTKSLYNMSLDFTAGFSILSCGLYHCAYRSVHSLHTQVLPPPLHNHGLAPRPP